MKASILAIGFVTLLPISLARSEETKVETSGAEQEIIDLSRRKWEWMAEKKVEPLAELFDDKAVFVHMGGSWGKDQEINIIKGGRIHYKHAEIESVSVRTIGETAILLGKLRLDAVVGGNEVSNLFVVTEVYVKVGGKWKLGSLSFTKQGI